VFSEQPTHTYAWQDLKSVACELASGWQCVLVGHPQDRSGITELMGRRITVPMTDVPNVRSFIRLLPIGGIGAEVVSLG
jgi:hypothetical protein